MGRFKTVEEEQKHYQELCFGEHERLGMKGETPYKKCCKNCGLVNWREHWEAIKRFDVENSDY